jgi:hypothetical protein
MIEIDENDMIDTHKLTKSEAKDFIHFLIIERERHIQNIKTCKRYINAYKNTNETICLAFDCSIHRHQIDIRLTNWTIKFLKVKFGVEK